MSFAKRDTRTGGVLEQMLVSSLALGKYEFKGPIEIGNRPHGLKHRVDKVAVSLEGEQFLISAKWQQVSGTVEEKIPYEVICLADAIRTSQGKYKKAYLVLGGDGWRQKVLEWYLKGGLQKYLAYQDAVEIVSLNKFVEKANKGIL